MAKSRPDIILIVISTALAAFGTLMVYSASAMHAQRETAGATQFTYFYKQLGFTVFGLVAMYLISRVDHRRYQNPLVVYSLMTVTVIFLLAVFAFPEINGAQRWIRFGAFSFQPSEMAKITLPIFLAYFLTRNADRVGEIRATVLPCVGAMLLFCGLVALEPDLGTALVLAAIFSCVYFAAGAKMLHVFAVGGAMAAVAGAMVLLAPWRLQRMMAFLDPFAHSDDAGYQVVQSLYAIGSGGIFGEGFARGQQKLFYLPYPYSDFIFSVVGEEFGLLGTLSVVLAFGVILWRGAMIAINAADRFGMLLAIGLVTGIIVQALFNISVVISILPAKGIPLPFISYGGSSVVFTLAAVGILLNISRGGGEKKQQELPEKPIRRLDPE
ncbi:putative lipid II flippase FtsW [Leptolyngbya sp. 7M]|uniref:putative lipid II flippase FtsW n=1 Tax=Leptolyngbya sp. 7M TaxID=2812896 RepID=UPI001B8C21B7|nr:putative lipid II flippase FtsW [Leptolyngbya sp. 7M]QYO63881.1 putative lipid II flippase FtsW [Leptolyngbya sp. 7M]